MDERTEAQRAADIREQFRARLNKHLLSGPEYDRLVRQHDEWAGFCIIMSAQGR